MADVSDRLRAERVRLVQETVGSLILVPAIRRAEEREELLEGMRIRPSCHSGRDTCQRATSA